MKKTLAASRKDYSKDPDYLAERLVIEINEKICELMERHPGMTRAELAKRMGVSRAHVTNILNGNHNLTILSLVKIGLALEARLKVEFEPIAAYSGAVTVFTTTDYYELTPWNEFVGSKTFIAKDIEPLNDKQANVLDFRAAA